jgi:NAD(P)-dependent dehydrogenase (short-subunit alcohol dehydrogenase family)
VRLSGRAALVTGGGSGIGRAIAQAMAAEGATVAVVDRDADRAQATVDGILAAGGSARAYQADVSSSAEVARMMAQVAEHEPGLDILVNNAGMGQLGTVTELDDETWDQVMSVNVRSVYLCSKAAIPLMPTEGGRIINVASVAGIVASGGRAAYCASKGAVVMLTRAMALDHAAQGITVNAICPGVVETAMTEASLQDPAIRQEKLDKTPLGWLAKPEHIAPAAVFLASADGAFMTGSCLVVDGGWSV